jgi:O-succinylbenzoate synthase
VLIRAIRGQKNFVFAPKSRFRGEVLSLAFQFRRYRLPLRVPLRTAHGVWSEREGLLVRTEGANGRVGFGEIAPIPWFGTETLAGAEEICGKLGDQVSPESLAAIPAQYGCTRFALAAALAAAESADAVPGPAQKLPVTALLPAGRDVLTVLPARLESGYLSFKWKVGVGDVNDELALLDDVLAALPSYAKLRLDANGAWDRRTAQKWLARCAERPVEFVEQPVRPDDESTLRGLSADFPVTLALDESVTGLAAAQRWHGQGWRGVFVIKPALAGPLPELVHWIATSKADVVLSSAIETALGRAEILRAALDHALTKRALGFGIGEVFGDRRWDGPVMGPVFDRGWLGGVDASSLWEALS